MVVLGKAKRNNEKFCSFYSICLGGYEHRISCRLDRVPTNYITNADVFLRGQKMEKVDKKLFMGEIWKKYKVTKDIELLAKACEEAPFFGQKEMANEIARVLRAVKKN